MPSSRRSVVPISTGAKGRFSAGRTLHDTHCHVDLFSNPAGVVRQAEAMHVYTIAVTTIPSCFEQTERLVAGSRYVRAALGLHPELVAERADELPLFLAALPRTRYVGEIGLDYTTADQSIRRAQRRILTEILMACDAAGDKILTVHSRRAADDVVDSFGASFGSTYILHWYSGGRRTLRRALANGAYVSVNLAMLRSDRGQAIVAEVPRERVLVESDGPFVAALAPPTVAAEVPAGPEHAHDVARLLSELWGGGHEAAIATLHTNFRRLLGLDATDTPSDIRLS